MRVERFRFHPEARQDLRDANGWYRNRSPSVASESRLAVSDVIRQIVKAPQRWPEYLHGTRRFVMHRFPFSIVYLDDVDEVSIVAIAHSKRKPGYWKARL